jgi:ATP-dependent Clp protease ATP-binding subunit ClpC
VFERYTEEARRAIFQARFEAVVCRSRIIERHHLLLGILQADPALGACFSSESDLLQALRQEFHAHKFEGPGFCSTEMLPFSDDSKRALSYAIEEADRLGSRSITTKHLFLGLLREEGGPAWEALARHGISLDDSRQRFAPRQKVKPPDAGAP